MGYNAVAATGRLVAFVQTSDPLIQNVTCGARGYDSHIVFGAARHGDAAIVGRACQPPQVMHIQSIRSVGGISEIHGSAAGRRVIAKDAVRDRAARCRHGRG